MGTPQEAIFREGSAHHYFLEFNLREPRDPARLRAALARVLDSHSRSGELLVAFGRDAWEWLMPERVPPDFIGFHTVAGPGERAAPGTQRDLFVWLHGPQHDHNLERARAIVGSLADVAMLELELHGFRYLDSRDFTGFVDGTENPRGEDARAVALLPRGQACAGGSFVLSQQWTHDLAAFSRLGLAEQERVIGRTRDDSVELEDMPADAHVSRVEVEIEGEPMEIYRRSTPWGGLRENGLYFLAFSRELMRFAIMLDRMFGRAADGQVDRLTEFSRPVTGSYWFAPSVEAMHELVGTSAAR